MEQFFIAIGGAPATGKTTLARTLAKEVSGSAIHRDEVLDEMFDPPDYSSRSQKDRAFARLLEKTDERLLNGENVIIESSFRTRQQVSMATDLAIRRGVRFLLIRCECPRSVALERMLGPIWGF